MNNIKKNQSNHSGLIGRTQELNILKILVEQNLNILVQGPVGIGKTFLIQNALQSLKRGFIRVDADARLSEEKLIGRFEPSQILTHGYGEESFRPGPLIECMTQGKVLFINELNRLQENVQNLLLPAIDEGLVQIPYLKTIKAKPGFLIIGTQNPSDFVATSDLSEAMKDRLEFLELGPMSASDVSQILTNEFKGKDKGITKSLYDFIQQSPLVLNKNSIRMLLSFGHVLQGLLQDSSSTTEAVSTACFVSLKNRLHLTQADSPQDSFKQFVENFLKYLALPQNSKKKLNDRA